jgi:hypothetical protein
MGVGNMVGNACGTYCTFGIARSTCIWWKQAESDHGFTDWRGSFDTHTVQSAIDSIPLLMTRCDTLARRHTAPM